MELCMRCVRDNSVDVNRLRKVIRGQINILRLAL